MRDSVQILRAPLQGRSQLSGELTLTTFVVLAAVLATALFGIYSSTHRSDEISVNRQIRVARHAIGLSLDELALQQETVAIWDESAAEMVKKRPDPTWLHHNIGLWLYNMFDHDEVFLLDGQDKPVQAAVKGRLAPNSRLETVRPDIQIMLEGVRGRLEGPNGQHDRNPNRELSPRSTVRTTGRATHDTHLRLVRGRPAAVSVMLIKPSTPGYVRPRGDWPVLVSVRFLDRDFLAELSAKHLIDAPRFSPVSNPGEGEQSLPLHSEGGQSLGYLIWRPELPGSRIFGTLLPMNGLVILALVVLMMLIRRRLKRTMTELSAVEAKAAHLAFHDALTGLPNRSLLNERIEEALLTAARGRSLFLILIDLDRFKQVNDTLGHLAGDRLIREFGSRLLRLVRGGDTVGRLGGDEFAILLSGWEEEEVEELCAAIIALFEEPFDLLGRKIFAGASIGAARAMGAALDGTELMRRADVAMYQAKADGGNCARPFEPDMDRKGRNRAVMEADLRRALDEDQLAVWYQPQVTPNRQTVGREGLLRWRHPSLGVVNPEQIIPIAEETGLIIPIGDWVLRQTAEAAAACPEIYTAVNLSPIQFRTKDFAEKLLAICEEANASPTALELEITERILLHDHQEVKSTLAQLRKAGFRIALDDFGTGYCSLSYLRRFPVDKIKIDRSFVADIERSADARAIVAAIVTLGHALNLTVSAEGVETQAQADLLIAAGCDELQGYFFAAPQPLDLPVPRLASTKP